MFYRSTELGKLYLDVLLDITTIQILHQTTNIVIKFVTAHITRIYWQFIHSLRHNILNTLV